MRGHGAQCGRHTRPLTLGSIAARRCAHGRIRRDYRRLPLRLHVWPPPVGRSLSRPERGAGPLGQSGEIGGSLDLGPDAFPSLKPVGVVQIGLTGRAILRNYLRVVVALRLGGRGRWHRNRRGAPCRGGGADIRVRHRLPYSGDHWRRRRSPCASRSMPRRGPRSCARSSRGRSRFLAQRATSG